MSTTSPLTPAEVEQLVADWYRKLDAHAPADQLLPMLASDGLEMRFPEGALHGRDAFLDWYAGVTRRFFDEAHRLKSVAAEIAGHRATVKVVVNWQARVWSPPAAKSQWLGFDAYQTWTVERSGETARPEITSYVVDALDPMPGSAAL